MDANPPTDEASTASLIDQLAKYGRLITPWAQSVATRMIGEVANKDRDAWRAHSAEMGRLLHEEIESAPTGAAMRQLLNEQTALITSLPTEAAERVRLLTLEGITNATRAEDVAREIMRTGDVTQSRALTIARTEVSRTATTLTQVRAQHVGSTHFTWRTAGDSDVRPSHRTLNRRVFAWNDPPECDPGFRALPGCIFNCRCVAIPIIDE